MEMLDILYISAQTRVHKAKEKFTEFMKSEKGVSNIVATIIILLIVVVIIGVFWDRLSTWLSGMMDSIFGADLPTKDDLT